VNGLTALSPNRFNPMDDAQSEFLVGQADKKIIQWSVTDDKIVQEYDQHLAAVNSITFVDGGRRFISSSDDKSLRVWEYGIPVILFHSLPVCRFHDTGMAVAVRGLARLS
jgi:pre-mRNA-processing factor 17